MNHFECITFILSDLFNFLAFFFAPTLNLVSDFLLAPVVEGLKDSSVSDPSSFETPPP